MDRNLKKVLITISLFLTALIIKVIDLSLWSFGRIYGEKIFLSFLLFGALFLFLKLFVEELLLKRLKDYKTRYKVRRATSLIFLVLSIAIFIAIWVKNTQAILVGYGLLAAGIAIALQDLFKGFTGGLLIMANNLYRIGDRIEVGENYGDVMDIGLLYTTLMETKGWVQGDQASGRIVSVPNMIVLSNPVKNYTKDHNFIWDEITLNLTYDSKWKDLMEPILRITREYSKDLTVMASNEVDRLGEKYYLPRRDVEPSVFVTFDKSWINVNIRYVTEVRKRRQSSDHLSRAVLEEVSKHPDVKIAQSQLESWKYGDGPTSVGDRQK